DVFSPQVTRALATLHAEVPPMPPRTTLRVLRAALDQPPERAFARFDPVPLAAASIGQVHRARLHTGEEVVVKVQRPGLKRVVESDLALMRLLARLLCEASPELAGFDPVGLLDAFERSIHAELDFEKEAARAQRIGRLLAGADEVYVPRIHAQ